VALTALSILVFAAAAYADEAETDDLQPKGDESTQETASPNVLQSSPKIESDKPSAGPKDPAKESRIRQLKTQFVDTSIEEKPATPASSEAEPKSPEYLDREAKLSEPLKKLLSAPLLFDSSKGGGSEFADAFVQAAKTGASARQDLLFIAENGSPAGKIYAALLIRMFDPCTGNRFLNGFKTDKSLVKTKTYVSQETYTVGEVVTDLLSPAPTIIIRTK